MKRIVFFSIWLLISGPLYSGEIVLSGTYQGKSVFVQNPFNHSKNTFCTKEVFVNDRKLFDVPQISAFKIDLSHLQLNDLVVIKITFDDGCTPRVVNPHVIQNPKQFKFISSQSDNQSISWNTAGEKPGGQFIIERYEAKRKQWEVIRSLLAKGRVDNNQYAIQAEHQNGENTYRVRYEDAEGNIVYSLELDYTSTDEPITFYPLVATNKLTLSDTTSYAITDYYGKLVKQGEGKEITVSELSPGEYYLNIQNRKEKFVKR
ncbi:T9SS C-terminal target domain-containing protein [Fulvivirga sp. 29W222]|uniref:T9SS C-terminal target domain-containing protein n=1 Tax=Fulvivirga marina TaxID=2494733 RepID=A0A937KAS1_9BACT|nr:T9SS C-terminal target domain-containing protein [Fulvivirga marina]MBL6445906.1 T9SS C-terminal target domain-containing protein [Fulvivirga marina]